MGEQQGGGSHWGLLLLICLLVVGFFWWRRRRNRKARENQPRELSLSERVGRTLMDASADGMTVSEVAVHLGLSERKTEELLRQIVRDHGTDNGGGYFQYDAVSRRYSCQYDRAEASDESTDTIVGDLEDRALDLLAVSHELAVDQAAGILGISREQAVEVYERLSRGEAEIVRFYVGESMYYRLVD